MRVLIVGNGRMGRFHTKTVIEAGDIAFTLDPYAPADVKFWDEAPKVDAAIIACPIEHLHVNALHATNTGLRVLVEKPAGATLTEVDHLCSINPNIAVGFVERANPVVVGLAKRCPNPDRVNFVRLGSRAGDNARLDLTSHDVDLHSRYFPGAQARFITGPSVRPDRRIGAGEWTADLVTRCLYRNDKLVDTYPMDDLLAIQYQAFRAGKPLATIVDAVIVHEFLNDEAIAA